MKKLSQYDYSLYIITDKKIAGRHSMTQVVKSAIAGGANIIQYREKTADIEKMVNQARLLHKITVEAKIPLIINDRIDIALDIGAEGVHVGQKDMPADKVRRLVGPNTILGVSASTVSQALQAEKDGADYLGVGPVFPTATKPDADPPIGLEGLKKIREAVSLPIIAIGSINKNNAGSVMRYADGIAVISAVMGANNPFEAARELSIIIRPKTKG